MQIEPFIDSHGMEIDLAHCHCMTDANFKFSNDLSLFTGVILPQTATHGAFPEQKKWSLSLPALKMNLKLHYMYFDRERSLIHRPLVLWCWR